MEKYCYLNGKIIETEKAKVSIVDIGILRGFGVFDGLRTYDSKPFLFDRHFDRLAESAKLIGLKLLISKKEAKKVVEELCKKNNVKDTAIRMILTGGESSDGTNFNHKKPTFYIFMHTLIPLSKEMYKNGVALITLNYQREFPLSKTNNYITKLANDKNRIKKDAHELLYTKDGFVLEGATCNIFMFKNKKLITPKDNILLGTRRWLVLKVAKNHFKIEERKVKCDELINADEIFITSSNRDILPVTKIDGKKIGNGKVGSNTKELMRLYQEYVQYELQKYK